MAAMRELPDIAMHAKSRLYERDRPIVQADLEELLRMLAEAKQRIDAEMQSDIAKSANTDDTEWDKAGYNVLVAPTIQMANSPQAIIDLTLAAANNGAKSAKLLYELMVAEMDVAVARFYVTLNTGLLTNDQT
jgi:phosphotransacetylase